MTAPRPRSRQQPKQLDAGILQAEISSFALRLAAEGKAAKTIRTYTEAVAWFAAAHRRRGCRRETEIVRGRPSCGGSGAGLPGAGAADSRRPSRLPRSPRPLRRFFSRRGSRVSTHPSSRCRNVTTISGRPDRERRKSTILDRNANACADFARRDQRTSAARSSPDSTSPAIGRPTFAMEPAYTSSTDFRRRTLGRH